MRRQLTKLAAMTLAGTMIFGTAAYADTVVVATAPTANNAATTATTAATSTGSTVQQNTAYVSDGKHIISSTGPTGSKTLTSDGVLVVAMDGSTTPENGSIGPGGSTTASTATTQTTTTAATTAAVNTSIAQPTVSAAGAVLYDATTNQILFQKNMDTQLAPASTTKLMTALLAVEKLKLTDTITVKASAVNNLESGATTAGMSAGDTITVNDALHAILIKSACEVANALGEAVSGSESEFAALMNQKAKDLGCTGTHFANASGLNSTEQYTTAHDMALITKAALDNETIRTITQKKSYTLPATASRGSLAIATTNKIVSGAYAVEGFIGGKTGFTSKAGSCLAAGAMRNGHELISVVLKESAPSQWTDTQALMDYGAKVIGGTSVSSSTPTAATTTSTTTAATTGGSWEKTASGQWKYKKADGTYYTNQWLDVNGNTYFFDSNSIMCTGWKQFTNKSWYYFNPENGAMVKSKWVAQNGKSYYLQKDGTMAVNTVIDGKYQVDENGVYVKKVG